MSAQLQLVHSVHPDSGSEDSLQSTGIIEYLDTYLLIMRVYYCTCVNIQLHPGDVPQPGPGDGPGLLVVVLGRPYRHPPRLLLRGRVLHQRPGPRTAAQPRPRLTLAVLGEGE